MGRRKRRISLYIVTFIALLMTASAGGKEGSNSAHMERGPFPILDLFSLKDVEPNYDVYVRGIISNIKHRTKTITSQIFDAPAPEIVNDKQMKSKLNNLTLDDAINAQLALKGNETPTGFDCAKYSSKVDNMKVYINTVTDMSSPKEGINIYMAQILIFTLYNCLSM